MALNTTLTNSLKGKVAGISMLPLIQPNDTVIYNSVNRHTKYKQGDIIIFYYFDKRITCHRIIDIKKNLIITKGDNCISHDKPISKKRVIGKLSGLIKKNKVIYVDNYLFRFLNMYLTLFSLTQNYIPLQVKYIPWYLFRGRRFLVRLVFLTRKRLT